MSHGHICGCYHVTYVDYHPKRNYLPQVQLESHTTISPLSFVTKLSQTFTNSTDEAIAEARYTFPLYDGVAVTAFACTIGDKVITGHVQQKAEARKTYDAAVERGESAGLLDSLPLGVFGITLGNIPAKSVINVDITYGGELKHDAEIDGLRYMLPTMIAPRYGSYCDELAQADTAIAKGIKITVDIDMQGSAVRKVQSPSKDHPISVSIGALSTDEDGSTLDSAKASVTLTHDTAELGSDFVVQILIDDISAPKAIMEKHSVHPNRYALMTTFVPKFNLRPIKPEIVFIADQSGSMRGDSNTSLVAALKTFIKSLPTDVHFNICAFGNDYKFLWPQSMPNIRETAAEALQFVETFGADYGGTEMRQPVVAAFKQHLRDLPLELIVLTDGAIYDEHRLFDFVSEKIHQEKVDARVFVLGVGAHVSHTLCEGLGRAGNGFSQLVMPGEVMDYKVVRMLKAALYPHITDYSLHLEYEQNEDDFDMISDADAVTPSSSASSANTLAASESSKPLISLFDTSADLSKAPKDEGSSDTHLPSISIPKTIQAPHHIPALLPFNRTTVQVLLHDTDQVPKYVVLRGTCSQGPLELKIPVQTLDSHDNIINSLAARKAIQELEENRGWLIDTKEGNTLLKDKYPSCYHKLVENELVRLGLDYQVANKWCSFVAVQDQPDDDKPSHLDIFDQEDVRTTKGNKGSRPRGQGFDQKIDRSARRCRTNLSRNHAVDTYFYPSRGGLMENTACGDRGGGSGGGPPTFFQRSKMSMMNPMPMIESHRPMPMQTYVQGNVQMQPQMKRQPQAQMAMPIQQPALDKEKAEDDMAFGFYHADAPSHSAVQRVLNHEKSNDNAEDVVLGGSRFMRDNEPSDNEKAPTSTVPQKRSHNHSFNSSDQSESDDNSDDDELTPVASKFLRDDEPTDNAVPKDISPAKAKSPRKARASRLSYGSETEESSDEVAPTETGPKLFATSPTDTLAIVRLLIDLQSFEGSWKWNCQLKGIFGKEAAAKHEATDYLLAWLQIRAADHKELWEMVADKARATLSSEKALKAARADVKAL